MGSLEDLVRERRINRKLKEQKLKKVFYFILIVFILLFLYSINKYIQDKMNYYHINYNDKKVSQIIIIDELYNIDKIINNTKHRYFIQIDISNNKDLLRNIDNLEKKSIAYYVLKKNKITKLNLLKSFTNLEKAENYARVLLKDKTIKNYTVRIRH